MVNAVVKQVVPFARQFINAVHIDRIEWMPFIDRQILGAPINLAGAGKNNFNAGIVEPARFQDVELCRGIDIQIGQRIPF